MRGKTQEELLELGELSRQALVAQARGEDTTKLVDQIASAIANTKIHVTIGPEQLENILAGATAMKASTS
jgi:hypothetical protein